MSLVPFLLACTGPSTPPVPAVPSAAHEAPAPPDVGDPLPPPSMVETMMAQALLDDPRVAAYLHLEVPENRPLRVHAVPGLAAGADGLRAEGESVVVVSMAAGARLQLTEKVALDGPRVRIGLAIPSEGVTGHGVVRLDDYVWSVESVELVER